MANQEQTFGEKLRQTYRLNVVDEQSFESVWSTNVSRLQLGSMAIITVTILTVLISILLIYTPLNFLFPHQNNIQLQKQAIDNALRIDSLENQLFMYERSYRNFLKILNGEEPDDFVQQEDSGVVTYGNIDFSKSVHDSVLRMQIEEEEQFNLSLVDNKSGSTSLERMHFFLPVKGMITNQFNAQEKHFGVDVVAAPNEPILSTLDGTVISSSWTLATGYVIQVQHDNNIVSFYKHNSVLLKEIGDHVKAGEPIAIIGNSGELTTGPHLHFELWYNGSPLDPEAYITF